ARKYWECWIVWLVVNVANIVLYISSGLYVMPIVSALYLANGIWSLIGWRRKYSQNE
ncbi:MAG: nicotinamide mononucleotide transporter, partial [Bacteroidales bacterium]|nr:nicotinamide mononucleotide transporter [Bacteroidales bacterium]